MSKDQWIAAFVEALRALRPHLTERYLMAVAAACYCANKDPGSLARAYHDRQIDQQPGSPFRTT
jgi:hypothetical protein